MGRAPPGRPESLIREDSRNDMTDAVRAEYARRAVGTIGRGSVGDGDSTPSPRLPRLARSTIFDRLFLASHSLVLLLKNLKTIAYAIALTVAGLAFLVMIVAFFADDKDPMSGLLIPSAVLFALALDAVPVIAFLVPAPKPAKPARKPSPGRGDGQRRKHHSRKSGGASPPSSTPRAPSVDFPPNPPPEGEKPSVGA